MIISQSGRKIKSNYVLNDFTFLPKLVYNGNMKATIKPTLMLSIFMLITALINTITAYYCLCRIDGDNPDNAFMAALLMFVYITSAISCAIVGRIILKWAVSRL